MTRLEEINKSHLMILFIMVMMFIQGCQDQKMKSKDPKVLKESIIEHDIRNCEKLIPHSVYDTNHIVIWRSGSIYFSEYTSCLIIEKKQFEDDQLLCYYFAFNHEKYSNYRNWKLGSIYELTLENKPFKLPLKEKTDFKEIDSLCFESNSEGIEANVYFMKDFNSDYVFPIHKKFNKNLIKNIEFLFKQISKKEHVQTLALIGDSVDYKIVGNIIKSDSIIYCIKDDEDADRIQRMWGDK